MCVCVAVCTKVCLSFGNQRRMKKNKINERVSVRCVLRPIIIFASVFEFIYIKKNSISFCFRFGLATDTEYNSFYKFVIRAHNTNKHTHKQQYTDCVSVSVLPISV